MEVLASDMEPFQTMASLERVCSPASIQEVSVAGMYRYRVAEPKRDRVAMLLSSLVGGLGFANLDCRSRMIE